MGTQDILKQACENLLMKNYKLTHLFPLPVYSTVFELTEEEIKIIYDCCAFLSPNAAQNFTTGERYLLRHPKLQRLKNFFEEKINFYAHDVLNIVEETQFYLTQSWANLSPKNSLHHLHRHPNSIISGVFFGTDNSNNLRFHRGLANYMFPGFEFKRNKFDSLNADSWGFPTKKNTLLIFPSNVEHQVEINKDDHPRLTISFNTFVKGMIGKENELSALKI